MKPVRMHPLHRSRMGMVLLADTNDSSWTSVLLSIDMNPMATYRIPPGKASKYPCRISWLLVHFLNWFTAPVLHRHAS